MTERGGDGECRGQGILREMTPTTLLERREALDTDAADATESRVERST